MTSALTASPVVGVGGRCETSPITAEMPRSIARAFLRMTHDTEGEVRQ